MNNLPGSACWLTIYGDRLDPMAVSAVLGAPTKSATAPATSVTAASSGFPSRTYWSLESDVHITSTDPGVHVRWIMSKLPAARLRMVSNADLVRVLVLHYTTSEIAGLQFDPDIMSYLQEIGAELCVQVEFWPGQSTSSEDTLESP